MAAALMTQWLFNFVIGWSSCTGSALTFSLTRAAKITPLMLDGITYGTFLLFGACCILMGIYTILCVPETKNVPLESIHLLFEGDIIKGCIKDTIPRHARAKKLQNHHLDDDADSENGDVGKGNGRVQHIEDA